MPATGAQAYVPRRLLQQAPDASGPGWLDGTCVLVDISGFTSLSEQLARRGRVGTEDLVTTLAEVFSALLSASEDGGDVLKFAGDALLLAYEGPDHAERACHAALAMQRTLDRVGRVRLAGARATLRMSVGVHSGRFGLLLTGTDHRNLVLHGPAVDLLLDLEARSDAGEVLTSRDTAALLPPSATTAPRGDDVRLVDVAPLAAVPTSPQPKVSAEPSVLEPLLPRCFAERPDLLDADSDHRRAAVGFVQVSGLGAVGDAAPEVVDALTARVEDACREGGVTLLDTDVSRDGFRYFVTAGAPMALEDAEGRLVQALASVVTSDLPVEVRAGVTAGRVFAGAVGSSERRTYTVMGDTTNLAARLTAKADPGTVLVHAPVLSAARTSLVGEPHDPIRVKGKAEPIEVVVVREQGHGLARGAASDSPFVGRATELGTVRTALDAAAAAGRGCVVEVVGEPGIGKSRLAREALSAVGWPSHVLSSDPYGASVPFRTLRQLLEAVLGLTQPSAAARGVRLAEAAALDPGLRPWLPLVASVVDADVDGTVEADALDDRFRRAKLAQVVVDLLAVAIDEPTVFLLDDAQWVDGASADVLRTVLAAAATHPWSVVLTLRDGAEGLGADDVVRVQLAALSQQAAQELVEQASALRPAAARRVLDRAEGNPFFLLELTDAATTGGALPDTVEVLVATQIDRLPRADRDVVRGAAVLGARHPSRLFAAVLDTPLLPPSVAPFLSLDGDDVTFTRAVHREVAYEQLTFAARRRLHREAARRLEEQPDIAGPDRLPMLSLHLDAAGDSAGAYLWSERAATAATDEHAHEAAVEFCRRAIRNGRRSGHSMDDLRPTYVRLGKALFVSAQYADAAQAYAAARRGVQDPAEATSLTYELGMVRREEGRLDAALAAARRARALAQDLDGEKAVAWQTEIDLLEAGVRYWQGRPAACLTIADRAATTAERLPAGRQRTQLVARAQALWDTAAVEVPGQRTRYGDQPLELFEDIGDLYNLTRFAVNVGYALFYDGDWDGAVARWRRSLAVAEQIGDVSNVAVNQMNIGEVLGYQGHLDEARRLLTGALRTLVILKTDLAAAHAACFLGVAERLSGDLDAAEAAFARAEELFTAAGRDSGFSLDELASRRLELRVDQGDAEAASELGLRLTTTDGVADVHLMRAHHHLARLDRDGADEHAVAALALAVADAGSYDGALVLADLGSDEQRGDAVGVLAALGVQV